MWGILEYRNVFKAHNNTAGTGPLQTHFSESNYPRVWENVSSVLIPIKDELQ
jgi:hypothetical protein